MVTIHLYMIIIYRKVASGATRPLLTKLIVTTPNRTNTTSNAETKSGTKRSVIPRAATARMENYLTTCGKNYILLNK